MGKPVNLNRFRKEKARAEKKARADQNAALHGLSKAEKQLAETLRRKTSMQLDGKKSDKDTLN